MRNASDVRSIEEIEERWAYLRSAERAFWWLPLTESDDSLSAVSDALRRNELCIALAWQMRRTRVLEAFAEPTQRTWLSGVRRDYQDWSNRLDPRKRSTRIVVRPSIEVQAPHRIDLSNAASQEIMLRVDNRAAAEAQAWIVLQYDPDLLEIQNLSGAPIYHEDLPGADRLQTALNEMAAPVNLPPGLASQFGLRVNLLRRAAGPVRLAIKTIVANGDATDGLTNIRVRSHGGAPQVDLLQTTIADSMEYARQSIEILAPAPPQLLLRAEGVANSWSSTPAGVLLYPFPNHDTRYQLSLVNQAPFDKTVSLELLALDTRFSGVLPDGELNSTDAQRELDKLGATTLVKSLASLRLPRNQSVPLDFDPPAAKPAAEPRGLPPVGDDAAPAPAQGDSESGSPAQDPAAPPPPAIHHGMILVATDLETGAKTLRRIQISPQRPRRFIQAEAAYDVDERKLTVRLAALDRSVLPPEGVRVRCDIAEPLTMPIQGRMAGVIQAPTYSAELNAFLPDGLRGELTLQVHVDDYPRAFLFRVPLDVQQRSIPQWTDVMQVRITEPLPNAAFLAPTDSIPIRFQVDAPPNSFETPGVFVEVGLDEDMDREFRGETTQRIFLDRQVKVYLAAMQGGGVTIATEVGDHQLDLPGRGLQNQRVNVLARLASPARSVWSPHVPIALDAAAPQFTKVAFEPGRTVAVGEPLKITVWCDGEDFSGVDKVEAAFDADYSGRFPVKPPPLPAKPIGDGRWAAALPTKLAGKQFVLLRATDKLGNAGAVLSYEVDIISKEEAERNRTRPNQVAGQVLFHETPVSEAKVTLLGDDGKEVADAVADTSGRFQLTDVKPGKYKIKATGVVYNKPRFTAEDTPIQVPPGPTRMTPLRILVE